MSVIFTAASAATPGESEVSWCGASTMSMPVACNDLMSLVSCGNRNAARLLRRHPLAEPVQVLQGL